MSTKKEKKLVEIIGSYKIFEVKEISESTGELILKSHFVTFEGREILYCGTLQEAYRKIEADKRGR